MMHREPHQTTQRSSYDRSGDVTRNSYFAKYRKQWENEMHFVVEDYKNNIFNGKSETTYNAAATTNTSEPRKKIS